MPRWRPRRRAMTTTVRADTDVLAANHAYPSRPVTCPTPPSPSATAARFRLMPCSSSIGTRLMTTAKIDSDVSAIAAASRTNGRLRATARTSAAAVAEPSTRAVLSGGRTPRLAQAPPVQRDRDEDQDDEQDEVGAAPAEPVVEPGRQRREDGAGQSGDQGQRGQCSDPPLTGPVGQRGERRRVQHAGHRDPGQHPADVEDGQVRGDRDGEHGRVRRRSDPAVITRRGP